MNVRRSVSVKVLAASSQEGRRVFIKVFIVPQLVGRRKEGRMYVKLY